LDVSIRKIIAADIPYFVSLADQLGYKTNKSYITNRIKLEDENEIVFVALNMDIPIGWIDCRISRTFLIEPICEIVGLIVDENYRSMGIGEMLNHQCEKWAMGKGINSILVRSNVVRERAHGFYLKNGYVLKKKSCVFTKQLF